MQTCELVNLVSFSKNILLIGYRFRYQFSSESSDITELAHSFLLFARLIHLLIAAMDETYERGQLHLLFIELFPVDEFQLYTQPSISDTHYSKKIMEIVQQRLLSCQFAMPSSSIVHLKETLYPLTCTIEEPQPNPERPLRVNSHFPLSLLFTVACKNRTKIHQLEFRIYFPNEEIPFITTVEDIQRSEDSQEQFQTIHKEIILWMPRWPATGCLRVSIVLVTPLLARCDSSIADYYHTPSILLHEMQYNVICAI